jgi:hypothetical protein
MSLPVVQEAQIDAVPPYSLHDFRGKYHLSNISFRAPVAGTQLRIERSRIENLKERDRQANRLTTAGVERRKMLAIAQKGLFGLTQAMKENYGLGKIIKRNELLTEFRQNELDRIIRAGSNIDKKTAYLFWKTVKYGDVPKIQSMCANGFEGIDMLDKNGESAVVHAVRNRHIDFAEVLLELGAFANAKDLSGSPALLMAWQDLQSGVKHTRSQIKDINKHIHIMIRAFFAHGADPNVQQAHDGLTGLHLSIRFNQPNIALAFIKFGADPLIKDNKGRNAAEFAMECGRQDMASVLMNFKHVTRDAGTGEFLQLWKKWLADPSRPPISITEPTAFLTKEFENAERALVGKRVAGLGLDISVEADPQDLPPRMSKKSKDAKNYAKAQALLTKHMVEVGKKHEKNIQTHRPSTHRLDHYVVRQPRNTTHIGQLESIIKRNYNSLSHTALRRKLHSCALAAVDISEEAMKTKRHRPARASVLFKRGKYTMQQTKVVDAAKAAGEMKAALRREERAALKRKQGKASATVNSRELLPPSLLETKTGYTRPAVKQFNRPVLQTWRSKPQSIQNDVRARRSSRFTAGGGS